MRGSIAINDRTRSQRCFRSPRRSGGPHPQELRQLHDAIRPPLWRPPVWLDGQAQHHRRAQVQTGGDATRLVGTLRALIKFANDTGEHKGDPTAGVKAGKMDKSDGFLAWPPEGEGDDPIAKYRAHYALGTVPRLAIELALNIAARREDMHVIGRQHHKNGAITWRP